MKCLPLLLLGLFSAVSSGEEGSVIAITRVLPDVTADTRDMTMTGPDKLEQKVHVDKRPIIADRDVDTVTLLEGGGDISVQLTAEGARKLAAATGKLVGERLAILVSGQLVSAPVIRTAPLGSMFQITGLSKESAVKVVAAFERGKTLGK